MPSRLVPWPIYGDVVCERAANRSADDPRMGHDGRRAQNVEGAGQTTAPSESCSFKDRRHLDSSMLRKYNANNGGDRKKGLLLLHKTATK